MAEQTKPVVATQETETADFYGSMEDSFGFQGNQLAIPLLLLKQGTTKPSKFKDAGMEVPADGSFYNSNTLRSYGQGLRVIPLYCTIMFYEWKPDQGGLVGRFTLAEKNELVHSGQVVGKDYEGFYRRHDEHGREIPPVDTKNGPGWNKLVETWVYALALPDYPEDGILCYNSTVGNIKYLKQWNSAMELKKLPTAPGKPAKKAPKFSQIWNIVSMQDETDSGIAYQFGAGGKANITFSGIVPPQDFLAMVEPLVALAPTAAGRMDVTALQEPAEPHEQTALPPPRVEPSVTKAEMDAVPF